MTARDDGAGQCHHCERYIKLDGGIWIDPEATGDDSMWREVCDEHDTFDAQHEPRVLDGPGSTRQALEDADSDAEGRWR